MYFCREEGDGEYCKVQVLQNLTDLNAGRVEFEVIGVPEDQGDIGDQGCCNYVLIGLVLKVEDKGNAFSLHRLVEAGFDRKDLLSEVHLDCVRDDE